MTAAIFASENSLLRYKVFIVISSSKRECEVGLAVDDGGGGAPADVYAGHVHRSEAGDIDDRDGPQIPQAEAGKEVIQGQRMCRRGAQQRHGKDEHCRLDQLSALLVEHSHRFSFHVWPNTNPWPYRPRTRRRLTPLAQGGLVIVKAGIEKGDPEGETD